MAQKKNQAGIAVAVWILIALVLLIIFLVKQDDILTILKDTEFFKHTIGSEPEFITKFEPKETPEKEEEPEVQIVIQTEKPVQREPVVEEPKKVVQTKPVEKTETAKEEPVIDDKPVIPKTNVKLYFVSISGDGSISRKQITRTLQKTNSPLTTAINALLEGPVLEELNDDCMTLIPEGSRLLSASVKDKVATLNFSEEFEFNRYGVEGYIGQLMQVVYTATAFSTVESVQFLVEGQRKEYIGSEGVWIGSPLSISSFK
ncbi:MAG: GerMN domain-containing protein [Spirochaetaceae bacterium]|nr:GerMN domain-containing protein [Spirochaetaceae bacterium]